MTIQEKAIEQLERISNHLSAIGEKEDYTDIAIQALEKGTCEDCISRKALLEEIENGIKAGNYEEGYEEYQHINDMDDIIECIKYADSVQPKTGHWLYNNGSYKCEFCGHEITGREEDLNYCCKCGAKLESEGKE